MAHPSCPKNQKLVCWFILPTPYYLRFKNTYINFRGMSVDDETYTKDAGPGQDHIFIKSTEMIESEPNCPSTDYASVSRILPFQFDSQMVEEGKGWGGYGVPNNQKRK